MTKEEWKLRKENAQLTMALAQSQSQIMQESYNKAKAALEELGEEWKEETVVDAEEVKP